MAVASVPRRAGGSLRASTLHGRCTCDWFVSPATWRRSWSARDRRSTRFRTSHRWLERGWMGEAHLLNRTFLREKDLRTMRCSHRNLILQSSEKLLTEWRYYDRVPTRMVRSRPSPRKPSIHRDVTELHRFLRPFPLRLSSFLHAFVGSSHGQTSRCPARARGGSIPGASPREPVEGRHAVLGWIDTALILARFGRVGIHTTCWTVAANTHEK